ncbi:AMP-binding protein [Microbacterium tumbae]
MRQSISSIIADRARATPDEVVVVDDEGTLTAAELESAAVDLAHALRSRGVAPDDLVMLSLPNGREFVIAAVAIWKAGATPEPVSPALTRQERAAIEAVSHPAAAIGAPPVSDGIAWLPSVTADRSGAPLPDLAAASWKAPTTSGSTGAPKVVKASGPALLDPTRQVAPFLPLRAVQLVAGPMTHSATFTYAFRGLFTGHRLIIRPRFDERDWLEAVAANGVTWALVVPTMMHRLLRLPAAQRDAGLLRTVESVLHMGAPCGAELKRAFLEWIGPSRVVEVYAGSESNGLTMIDGEEWLRRPGSVGRPIGGTRIEIRDESGAPCETGRVGQVWMHRGERPAYEYLGARTRRDRDGWDTLGDLGSVDAEGYLYLRDRADDVINRGGEKIYPASVEAVLEQHPAVRSAVVFGEKDEEYGQRVVAVADIGAATVSADELRAWARERLGPRSPSTIRIVREPVRNDAGKTARRSWAGR